MTPTELAQRYLDVFCSGHELGRLYEILAEDLVFDGPFFYGTTARAYVESLVADPPAECSYDLLHAFADGAFVNLIYRFEKPDVEVPMSQFFVIENGRISRILLIFDTGAFRA